VFRGQGEHWSFVQPSAAFGTRVARTSEKQRISALCCTGLYHFARAADFVELCEAALREGEAYRARWGELYIAPLYNGLLARGGRVVFHEIAREQVHFAGTPQEYQGLLAAVPPFPAPPLAPAWSPA
jgi:dTDP-glucose pyrophosphorylase